MSIWICTEHGMVGCSLCCGNARRMSVADTPSLSRPSEQEMDERGAVGNVLMSGKRDGESWPQYAARAIAAYREVASPVPEGAAYREALEAVKRDIETCEWGCERCGHDPKMRDTDIYLYVTRALAPAPAPSGSETADLGDDITAADYLRIAEDAGILIDEPEFDPSLNCPTHFVTGDPSCPACRSKQRRPTPPPASGSETGDARRFGLLIDMLDAIGVKGRGRPFIISVDREYIGHGEHRWDVSIENGETTEYGAGHDVDRAFRAAFDALLEDEERAAVQLNTRTHPQISSASQAVEAVDVISAAPLPDGGWHYPADPRGVERIAQGISLPEAPTDG